MKRQLSAREVSLLGVLLVVVLVGGYLLLFRIPMQDELARLEDERIACEEQLVPAMAKIAEMERMEKELKEIVMNNSNPPSLAPFDNQKPVMYELNAILQSANEYYLSFSTVNTGNGKDALVRRQISLRFTAAGYDIAKEVLGKLHDSIYRCMLDDLSISLGEGGGAVSVDVTLVYFEYQ